MMKRIYICIIVAVFSVLQVAAQDVSSQERR